MKGIGALVFPGLMLVGLVLSVLVFVSALQAVGQAAAPVSESVTAEASQAQVAGRGRALFLAKGCLVCHQNDRVTANREGGLDFGDVPNLTHVKIDETYLRRWLHDPKEVKPGTAMPNLGLSDDEVDALVVFLRKE